MNYGDRFKAIRIAKGYESRQKLADMFSEITGTKFHQQTIGRFEREEYEPSLDQLVLYSKALNVSVDYLLGLNDTLSKEELDFSVFYKKYEEMQKQISEIKRILNKGE